MSYCEICGKTVVAFSSGASFGVHDRKPIALCSEECKKEYVKRLENLKLLKIQEAEPSIEHIGKRSPTDCKHPSKIERYVPHMDEFWKMCEDCGSVFSRERREAED